MLISITHDTTDPANWVLRQWKVSWWRKQQVLCRWFIDREQAIRHAEWLKSVYTAGMPRPT
ncbi:MAG: hypothetical protein MUE68_02545 [Bacteroidetes bacterium]|jgi:hypothetical protein|nr:hypothetical protein [Bacteroidota bacterium]